MYLFCFFLSIIWIKCSSSPKNLQGFLSFYLNKKLYINKLLQVVHYLSNYFFLNQMTISYNFEKYKQCNQLLDARGATPRRLMTSRYSREFYDWQVSVLGLLPQSKSLINYSVTASCHRYFCAIGLLQNPLIIKLRLINNCIIALLVARSIYLSMFIFLETIIM